MENRKNKIVLMLCLIVIVFTFVYGIYLVSTQVSNELDESIEETVYSATVQQQTSINDALQNKIRSLVSISGTLAELGESNEVELTSYLTQVKNLFGYDSIIVSDLEGRAILSTGEYTNVAGEEYFLSAFSGEVDASSIFESEYTGNDVLAISTQIVVEGEFSGVLIAFYAIDYLEPILLSYTNNLGYSVIVDSTGELLMTTMDTYSDTEGFKNAVVISGRSMDEMFADFASGAEGSTVYELSDSVRISAYVPIEINDWMLFFTVPEDEMVMRKNNINGSIIFFISIMTVFFVIFVAYILITRKLNIDKIKRVAYIDELTGLPNLIKFKLEIEKAIKTKPNDRYILVKMDIANFKVINELYSFETGNKVLKSIATTSKVVDDSSFIMARTGPDEFMMFSDNNLLERLGETRFSYEQQFRKSIPELDKHSIQFRYGRYYIDSNDTDVNDIVNKVNLAHNYAKSKSIDIIWDYDDKYKQRVLKNASITNKMESALKNQDFKVFLQPKYRISDQKIIGAEALVRWIEPDGSMIYPDMFIPLFESNGFIVELDKFILSQVCSKFNEWFNNGLKCVPISVNFSKIHLNNPQFVEDLKAIVHKFSTPANYIEIEFTETTVTETDGDTIEKLLDDLHDVGFDVSIDDFGAGYSSLGMLKNFKVDTLKLDRSFFLNNKYDKRGDLVINGIIKLAHSLGMKIVAEGVEEPEQVQFLKGIDCESAQGYYFAKPMPVKDFEKLLFGEDYTSI